MNGRARSVCSAPWDSSRARSPRRSSWKATLIGLVGVIAGVAMGLIINLSLMQVGMDYSQFAGITDYMALISGRVYPTLGVSRLFMRAAIMFVIAALAALIPALIATREPSEALHHV